MIKITRNVQKIISISILLVMILSAFPVFALEEANVSLEDKSVIKDGEGIVTVDLSLEHSVTAASMNFTIKYDTSKLEIVQASDVMLNNLLITNWGGKVNLANTGEIYIIAMSSTDRSIMNETPPIKLASIKFKVKSTSTLQTIPLVFVATYPESTMGKIVDGVSSNIPLNLKDGSISVVNRPRSGGSSVGGSTPTPTPTPSPSASPSVTPSVAPSASPEVSEAPHGSRFVDLSGFEWANESINELEKAGVVNGDGNKFRPADNVTRAEFAKLVVAGFKLEKAKDSVSFNDVKADDWFASFIDIAASNGVVTGYDGGIYDPNKQITREELCVMVVRSAKSVGLELPPAGNLTFTDSDKIEDYAKDSVAILSGLGIVNGKGDGVFAPKDNATRAESAKIIYGIVKLLNAANK